MPITLSSSSSRLGDCFRVSLFDDESADAKTNCRTTQFNRTIYIYLYTLCIAHSLASWVFVYNISACDDPSIHTVRIYIFNIDCSARVDESFGHARTRKWRASVIFVRTYIYRRFDGERDHNVISRDLGNTGRDEPSSWSLHTAVTGRVVICPIGFDVSKWTTCTSRRRCNSILTAVSDSSRISGIPSTFGRCEFLFIHRHENKKQKFNSLLLGQCMFINCVGHAMIGLDNNI